MSCFIVLCRRSKERHRSKRRSAAFLISIGRGPRLRSLLDQASEQTVPNYESKLSSAGDAIRQGEAVAQEERRRLGLGIAPIINTAETISEQGVWTAATELPNGLSGLFVNHPSIGLAILVNASHRPVRRRFSYAHEYAHALFDRSETITTTRSQNSTQLAEKRANAFAAAFLIPAEGVADHLRQLDKGSPSRRSQSLFDVANNAMMEAELRTRPGSQAITYQDVASLARRFGVSYEAAVVATEESRSHRRHRHHRTYGSEGDWQPLYPPFGLRGTPGKRKDHGAA